MGRPLTALEAGDRLPDNAFCDDKMSQLVDLNGGYYRLVAAYERSADAVAVEFLDERQAYSFLKRLTEDEFNCGAIRRFAVEHGFTPDARANDDHRLLRHLAAVLVSGRVQAVRTGDWRKLPTSGSAQPGEEEEPEEEEKSPPLTDEKTWIKFEVVDADSGAPVKGVTLKVKLPDGQTRNATTDGAGVIEIKDIPPGTCEIDRMIDSDTLEVVAVE